MPGSVPPHLRAHGQNKGDEEHDQECEGDQWCCHVSTVLRCHRPDEWQICHVPVKSCHTVGMALHRVVSLVLPGVAPFELGVTCELFGVDRSDMAVPVLDFRLITPDPGPVPTSQGFAIEVADDEVAGPPERLGEIETRVSGDDPRAGRVEPLGQ